MRRAKRAWAAVTDRLRPPRTNEDAIHRVKERSRRPDFAGDVDSIRGWLTPAEKTALYYLGRFVEGPLLEIGPWAGLSTVCIIHGIVDSGRPKRFITAELNPKLENYRPFGDGIGFFVPGHAAQPCGVCPIETYEREIEPVVSRRGGVIGLLRENLERKKLARWVEIHEGDFRAVENLTFNLVFADTMHDPTEISQNAPAIRALVRDGSVIACHDTDVVNEACLRSHISFRTSVCVDSLFIGVVGPSS
jgi:predicted O-methyltransferase YrrM